MKVEKKTKSFDGADIYFDHYVKKERYSVLVICHGFLMTKNAEVFRNIAEDFFEMYDVIVMDQRGHGKSKGSFSFTSKEHKDIKAVIEYAEKYYKNIFLMGFSLGAASSIIETAKEKNVKAVIAVSPPSDFMKIENKFWRSKASSTGFNILKTRFGNVLSKKEKPVDLVSKISPIPVLIIHGDNDNIIFRRHAEILYEKAREPKKVIFIKGGLHAEQLYEQDRKGFIKHCVLWLNSIY